MYQFLTLFISLVKSGIYEGEEAGRPCLGHWACPYLPTYSPPETLYIILKIPELSASRVIALPRTVPRRSSLPRSEALEVATTTSAEPHPTSHWLVAHPAVPWELCLHDRVEINLRLTELQPVWTVQKWTKSAKISHPARLHPAQICISSIVCNEITSLPM